MRPGTRGGATKSRARSGRCWGCRPTECTSCRGSREDASRGGTAPAPTAAGEVQRKGARTMNAAVRGENSGGRVYFVTFSRRAWQAVLLALAVGFLALAAWWQQRPEGEAPPGPAATDAVAPSADADVLSVPAAASGPAADDSAAVSLTPAPPA